MPTLLLTLGLPALAAKPDGALIEKLAGAPGKLDAKENVFKVSVSRTDLAVTAAGVKLTPAMGLTSWAAFTPQALEATKALAHGA